MIASEALRSAIDRTYFRMRGWKFRKNQIQKIPIEIISNRYAVKTISLRSELEAVCKLRFEVFFKEGLHRKAGIQYDLDRFDFVADHLCVFDLESNRIVGTYRLLSDMFTKKFYSETEFDLRHFLERPGRKLEMGRACIEPSHRNGVVIALLWKAIYEYMQKAEARYLFGCTSFKTQSSKTLEVIRKNLCERDAIDPELEISVLPNFRVSKDRLPARDSEDSEADKLSGLVRSYIKAGAKFYSEPAFDAEFQCFDFFTYLDLLGSKTDYHRYGRA
jgi:putative hemolysin